MHQEPLKLRGPHREAVVRVVWARERFVGAGSAAGREGNLCTQLGHPLTGLDHVMS